MDKTCLADVVEGIFIFQLVPHEEDLETLSLATQCWNYTRSSSTTRELYPLAHLLYNAIHCLVSKSHIKTSATDREVCVCSESTSEVLFTKT